jgi:hypothetical protein
MEKFSLSFNFIPYKDLPVFKDMFELVDFEQDSEALKNIGIESKSAISNIFSSLIVLLFIILLH